jgi:hypothetical protein
MRWWIASRHGAGQTATAAPTSPTAIRPAANVAARARRWAVNLSHTFRSH